MNAQKTDPVFRNYSTKDGLSQRSVITIAQDSKGYMWFGTRYGLNKFDGHSFVNYYYNSADENSLSDSWINSLYQDANGTLWIGTKNGLNTYDWKEDNFIRTMAGNLKGGVVKGEIKDIIPDNDPSILWLATNNGLWRFDINEKKLKKYQYIAGQKSGLSSNVVRSLMMSKDGRLWVCTDLDIAVFDPKSEVFVNYNYPGTHFPMQSKNANATIFEDSEKQIWLGHDSGLAVLDIKQNRFVDYTNKHKIKVIASSVRSIHEDTLKNIWVGTYEGLFVLAKKDGSIKKYVHDVTNPKSISQNSVYDIFSDDRGDIWIGTWAGGVNYLDQKTNEFATYTVGTEKTHLSYPVVSAAVEDDKGNLWVGTEGGGINVWNADNGEFTHYMHDRSNANSLSDNNIKALLKDHKGNLWIGTHNSGLSHVVLTDKKLIFKQVAQIELGGNGLSSNQVTALLEDVKHRIWIGTANGGLNIYDYDIDEVHQLKSSVLGLGNFVHTIAPFSDTELLIGGEKGLHLIDINTYHTTKINFKKVVDKVYEKEKVISLYLESHNIVWIGTEGDGLFKYDLQTKTTRRYSVKDGLPGNVIYGIVQDEDKNLWVSTNYGLGKFNPTTYEYQNFDYSDGIQGNEFNYGSYLKKNDGRLFFGGVNGFTLFDPNKIGKDDYFPRLTLQSFKTRSMVISLGLDDNSDAKIELSYNQNDVTFNYAALGFSHPTKNEYAYFLEGFDNDWNYVENARVATYTNLDPGTFTFKVRATNGDGVWGAGITSITFVIHPPLWKTWWAYLTYFLIFSFLFFVIRKYSILRIQEKAELKKERQDREREEQLNRLKLQLFTNISHDFRTPLTLIIGPLKKLIDTPALNGSIKERLSGMYRNATILLQLINQLLDFRKSEAGKLILSAEKKDIIGFIRDTKLLFEEFAREKEIDYTFTASRPRMDIWFDEIEMKKVIINILANSFKFTPSKGKVSIVVKENQDLMTNKSLLCVTITDNGKGIRKEDLPNIFDRYFQLGQKNEIRSGTGVGLALAKDIVDMHKGDICVESELGKGTTFTILLPFGVSHLSADEMKSEAQVDKPEVNLENFNPVYVKTGWTNHHENEGQNSVSKVLAEDKETLLLVEDNFEVRNFIKELFVEKYNVLEGNNGHKGLELARLYPIDLIISDVMMPQMDGMEFCKTIKQDVATSHIPVILLTARTSTKIQKVGYHTGADVYITKPFDSDLLMAQVLNLLKSRKNLIDKFRKDIILTPEEITPESPDELFLSKAMAIVQENLETQNFSVVELSKKMNTSQSVLYRKIKVLTGLSISGFIRTVRLKRAAQLLKQTNTGISIIAYDVGFSDLKYFRKCFKEEFDATPSLYRKNNQK